MFDPQLLIIIAVITVVCLMALKIYTYRKSRFLRELGYTFVYYYMKNCGDINYYRISDNHIATQFKSSFDILDTNKNKWFLGVSSRIKVNRLIDFYKLADNFTTSIQPFFFISHYFAHSENKPFEEQAKRIEENMRKIVNDEFRKFITKSTEEMDIMEFPRIRLYKHNLESLRKKHNKEFVEQELRNNKLFFDSVLEYPLDSQQRESIVKLEDNCLVISSAGSGKTSTSIAKVKYLLERRRMKKEEILVVSYNRKTADEFQERLNVSGLTCKTFHALALSIIGEVEGKRPDVCEPTFLLTCYYNLVKKNKNFKAAINEFVSVKSSLTKGEHEYETGEEYFKDRRTYGIMSPYGDMNGSPIYTRSEEEKKICVWLSSHNMDFLYEQPYPIDTANTQHRQYKPDFTIYFTKDGKRYFLFLEHFGIDRDGNVPKWFGDGENGFNAANQKYNNDIIWKRNLHVNNHTKLIETTSAMFHDGTVYRELERQLREVGVPMRLLSEDEKYAKLIERNKAVEDSVTNLFSSFISLMKSNDKTFETIMEDIKKSDQGDAFNERCRYLMYELIKPLYDEYERAQKEKGQMDFTDLVLHAADLCGSGKYKTPYSYILVDEFQDISVDRYKFILSLRKHSPLTKTFCVGDDWQSIYRFSGSDMNLFNHFEDYFGFTERCKIETTYRFGNPLVERSSEFILKNPNQVEKVVHPLSDSVLTKLSFIPFKRGPENQEYLSEIKQIIDGIPSDETVMLMARYNYEAKVFPPNCVEQLPNSKRAKVTYAGRKMDFMSVHAAKGLEADNVIILNCSQDHGGFPSRITDDPILGFVLSEIDTFEYSEERRLFYVAITRAKKHTFVMYNAHMASEFVTEMQEKDDKDMLICPRCKKGRLKMIKEDVSVNGNPYRNYLCSNSIAGCRFFWQVFYDNVDDIPVKYHRKMDRYFQPHAAVPLPPPTYTHILQLTTNRRVRNIGYPAPPPVAPPPILDPIPTEGSADDLPF